jgi:predicted neutral ceramidase superfamily lipid hydrolase
MKNLHTPSLIAGALAATLLISLGLSFPISIEIFVAYAAVVTLVALAMVDLVPKRKRLQVK